MPLPLRLVAALLLAGALGLTPTAYAQPNKPVPAKKWGKKPVSPSEPVGKKPKSPEPTAEPKPEEGPKDTKGAGTEEVKKAAQSSGAGPAVVETKTGGEAGVKTYKFGAVEVEGRLKSPQVVYFMRRVRAEFAAGALGHRSFLRELGDTRRSPAFK